jgi:hypothetical protein
MVRKRLVYTSFVLSMSLRHIVHLDQIHLHMRSDPICHGVALTRAELMGVEVVNEHTRTRFHAEKQTAEQFARDLGVATEVHIFPDRDIVWHMHSDKAISVLGDEDMSEDEARYFYSPFLQFSSEISYKTPSQLPDQDEPTSLTQVMFGFSFE